MRVPDARFGPERVAALLGPDFMLDVIAVQQQRQVRSVLNHSFYLE